MLRLSVFDGLREELRKLIHGLLDVIFFDGSYVVDDGAKLNLFLDEILVIQQLAEEIDEVIGQYAGQGIGIGNLNDLQQFGQVGAYIISSAVTKVRRSIWLEPRAAI